MAAVNSLLVPFFPFVARNKGVSEPIIGLIFSIAYLGSFLSSVIIGKMLHRTGRKRLILVGLAIQAINVMVFGMVVHI
jgi:MFS family permease